LLVLADVVEADYLIQALPMEGIPQRLDILSLVVVQAAVTTPLYHHPWDLLQTRVDPEAVAELVLVPLPFIMPELLEPQAKVVRAVILLE
jgi:hypothetical protein